MSLIYARNSMIQLSTVYVIILFQGPKKLQINMHVNSSERQAIVSMKWQHQLVRTLVSFNGKSFKVGAFSNVGSRYQKSNSVHR